MPKAPSRTPVQIIDSIESKASLVRDAASLLSDQIRLAVAVLNKIPGRVETTCYGAHPDDIGDDLLSIGLKFERAGKEWNIFWGEYHEEYHGHNDNPVKWEPLVDAPLKMKLAAVKILPDILTSIEKSQAALVDELTEAASQLQAFNKSVVDRLSGGKQ